MIRGKAETFNDGRVHIFNVDNGAESGDMATTVLRHKFSLSYKERTVGVNRYYAALQANAQVDRVLRCPRIESISTQDIAIPNGKQQYRIIQIQYPEDIIPPVMDLTLQKTMQVYKVG